MGICEAMGLRLPLIACWLVLGGCSGSKWSDKKGDGDRSETRTAIAVDAQPVSLGTIHEFVQTHSVVESQKIADLMPSSSGVVVFAGFEIGDEVQQGDVLAILDNVSLDVGAERAQREVSRLEQQVRQQRMLLEKGAISRREFDDLMHELRTARSSAREAKNNFGQTRLTAPFGGVVASRDLRVGEYVLGNAPAFRIVDPQQLRVVVSLPEREIGRVEVGASARLQPAYHEDQWLTGVVARVAPVVDVGTGTFKAIVRFPEGSSGLLPGQFVSVHIQVEERKDVVVVPLEAVVYENGRPTVFVMVPPEEKEEEAGEGEEKKAPRWQFWKRSKDDETESQEPEEESFVARRRAVEIGIQNDKEVEITDGLSVDDAVIVVGQSVLKEGFPVRVLQEAIAEEAPAEVAPPEEAPAEELPAEKPAVEEPTE